MAIQFFRYAYVDKMAVQQSVILEVTRKKPLVVYVKRALHVLEKSDKVIYQATGAAVRVAVWAAQDTLQQSPLPLRMTCQTGTVAVLSDKVDFDAGIFDTNERFLPSISIVLCSKK
eukprot:GEMP01094494.1.p1 GENE.GEMP01094494.1~~GEMP01094494.1.p1  ORF type:complete len:116 (-),score=15.55 GEMP01094494.1:447-794(-)